MIERVLNKLGLYTEKQWNMALKKIGELKKEIEKLRLKVARSVKRRVR